MDASVFVVLNALDGGDNEVGDSVTDPVTEGEDDTAEAGEVVALAVVAVEGDEVVDAGVPEGAAVAVDAGDDAGELAPVAAASGPMPPIPIPDEIEELPAPGEPL